MALSTSSSVSSSLDINSIVSQLMAVERQPLTAMSSKEASYQAKLSAVGNLKSALSTFQTAVKSLSDVSKFQAVRASIGDTAVASVTAASGTTAGSFSLEVSKLAQAQKLASAGQASTGAVIGTGTLTFDFGTIKMGTGSSFDSATGKYTGASFESNGAGAKTVTIGPGDNTLAGIRDAINKAGIGVTASIVNDGGTSPYRLVLTEQSSGKTNSMKITVTGDAGLKSLLQHDPAASPAAQAFSETVSAQNAEFKIDGIAVSKPTNAVSDVITGLTLNLNKTNAGSPTSINVTRDTTAVSSAVAQFVTAYNQINQTLTNLSSYNTETKKGAVLNGDATVRTIQTQLRGLLSSPVTGSGAYSMLSQVGVTVQKDGNLALDNSKLQKAMESNFADIAGLFAAAGKSSDALVSYSSATSKTKAGDYAVEITRLATQGKTIAGGAPATLTVGSTNDTLEVKLDNVTATIKLAQKTYASVEELALEIQSKINGAREFVAVDSKVSVTQDNGKLVLTSARYGSASNITITGGSGMEAVLGTGTATTSAGQDVAGTIGGTAASGSGQFLTGAGGSAAEGLKLQINGGAIGSRGVVSFSNGYAHKFDKLIESLLASDGPIASKTEGLNATLKTISQQKQRFEDRLVDIEKRYRAQYTALDVTLAGLQKTSNYLTQQLANLSA